MQSTESSYPPAVFNILQSRYICRIVSSRWIWKAHERYNGAPGKKDAGVVVTRDVSAFNQNALHSHTVIHRPTRLFTVETLYKVTEHSMQ